MRTIIEKLRAGTKARHAALEGKLPLLDPHFGLDAYRQLLGRFYGYYAPLEARLLDLPSLALVGVHYEERRKTPHLERDLLALGETSFSVSRLPLCEALPSLDTLARAMGCLYVIEGSTLGGQFITRHLSAKLGLTRDTGGAFFFGYGLETGPRWKAFCELLTALAEREKRDEEIVASAELTFATIDAWLFPLS